MSGDAVSPFVGRYDELLRTLKPNYPLVLGPRTLTYGQLFDQVPRMATLFARLGMTYGDRIAIVSNRELAIIPIFLSLLRCGITAAVLNPRSSRHELAVVLAALEPSAIFADNEIIERAQLDGILNGGTYIIHIDDEKPQRSLFGNRSVSSTHSDSETLLRYPAMLQRLDPIAALPNDLPNSLVTHITFTSGTTSRPKGVELTHRAVFGSLANTDHVMGYDSGTRILKSVSDAYDIRVVAPRRRHLHAWSDNCASHPGYASRRAPTSGQHLLLSCHAPLRRSQPAVDDARAGSRPQGRFSHGGFPVCRLRRGAARFGSLGSLRKNIWDNDRQRLWLD